MHSHGYEGYLVTCVGICIKISTQPLQDDREVSDIDSLIDFFAILNLELNDCGTKKDINFTLLMVEKANYESIFKNLCASNQNLRSPKSSYFDHADVAHVCFAVGRRSHENGRVVRDFKNIFKFFGGK